MAAGGTTSNLQIGPGRLYVAPLGTVEPVSASAALPSAWLPIGYTEGGSAFHAAITNTGVDVAEEIDPVLYLQQGRVNTVTFAMVEMTRRNLSLALGSMQVGTPTAFYEPPDPGSELPFILVWDSNEDPTATQGGQGNRRWIFRQAKSGGTIDIARGKVPAKATLPVTLSLEKPVGLAPFRVYPNSNGLV